VIETDGVQEKLLIELCKLLKILHIFSSPMHAAGNCEGGKDKQDFDVILETDMCETGRLGAKYRPVLFAFRAGVSIPLGISPFRALFGRQMTIEIDLSLVNEFE